VARSEPFHPASGVRSAGWFLLCAAYASTFMVSIPRLPHPFGAWAPLYRPLIRAWWMGHAFPSWPRLDRFLAMTLLADVVLGVAVPIAALAMVGRSPFDAGMGRPNRLGWRFALFATLAVIPFGCLILGGGTRPMPWPTTRVAAMAILDMVPEHFFVCGVTTALLLPNQRLAGASVPRSSGGPPLTRAFQWLGLAHGRPTDPGGPASFWGLDRASLWAIVGSGLVFGWVHVGKPNDLEVALAFPGGVAAAYVTLRASSIWPALIAHWSMNLVPMAASACHPR
jgi:Type II CAAX prenyl endopeptidase Rce1-like